MPGELAPQFLLGRVGVRWRFNVQDDVKVAVPIVAVLQSTPPDAQAGTIGAAGWDFDSHRLIKGRHYYLGAENRLPWGDRQIVIEVDPADAEGPKLMRQNLEMQCDTRIWE